MSEELSAKINDLKLSIQTLWERISENDFELARKKITDVSSKVQKKLRAKTSREKFEYDDDYDHHYAEDLPLTIMRDTQADDGAGVKYYTTENSPLAIGAEKVEAGGIDKFGDEEDTFSFEAADDYQDNRNRHQNSDLADRFRTPGLDTKDMQ